LDLNEPSNDEILMLALEENEDAKKMLFEKFSIIINYYVFSKYNNIIKFFNIDREEVFNEGLIGIYDLLYNYSLYKGASIKTFGNICIKRKILIYLKKMIRRNTVENMYVDEMIKNNNYELFNVFKKENIDPLDILTLEENIAELKFQAQNLLSDSEYKVFQLIAKEFSYQEIALLLNKNIKQVYNAMERIRYKLRNDLEMA